MPYFHYNQTQRHRYYGQFFTSLDLTSSLNSTRLIRTPRDMMISTLLTLAVRRMHVIHGPFIWPNTPRVLQSLIAQCLEHSTGVRGLRIFSLSHGSWHVDHIIHFFTELKIEHLSLYMTPRWYRHFLCPTPPPPNPAVCILTGFDCICKTFQEVNHHKLFLLTTVYILQTWRKMHHSYSISCADYKNGDYPKIYNDQVQSRNHGLTQAGKKTKTNLN